MLKILLKVSSAGRQTADDISTFKMRENIKQLDRFFVALLHFSCIYFPFPFDGIVDQAG